MALISRRIVAFAALTLVASAGAAVTTASACVCGWASKGLRRAGKKGEKVGGEDGARQAQPSSASRTQEGGHNCVVQSTTTTSKDAQAAQGLIAALYTALTQLAIRRALCFRATFTGFDKSPSVGKASAVVTLQRALLAAKSSSSALATQGRQYDCPALHVRSGSVSSRKALPRSALAGPVVPSVQQAGRAVDAGSSTQVITGRVVCGFTLGSGSRTEVCVGMGYNMRTGLELGVSMYDRLSGVRKTLFVTLPSSASTARDIMTTIRQAMAAPLSPKQATRHVKTLCAALRSVGLTLPTTTHTDDKTNTPTHTTLICYLPQSITPVTTTQVILCSAEQQLTAVAAAPSIKLVQPQRAVVTARVAAVRGGGDAARAAWAAALRRAGSTLVAEAALIAYHVNGLALCTVTPASQVKGVCKEWRPYALKGAPGAAAAAGEQAVAAVVPAKDVQPVAAAAASQGLAAVVPAKDVQPAAAAAAIESVAAMVQETAPAVQAVKPGKLSKGQKKSARNKAKKAAGAAEQTAAAESSSEQPAVATAVSEQVVTASGTERPAAVAVSEPAPAVAAAVTAGQDSCAAEQPVTAAQATQSDEVATTKVSTPVVQASKNKGKKGGKKGKAQQGSEPAASTAVVPAVPAEEASPASDTAVAASQPAADSRNSAVPTALPASSDAGQGAVAAAESSSSMTATAAAVQPEPVPAAQVSAAAAAAAEPVTPAADAEQACLAPAAAVPAAKQAATKKKSKGQKVSLADLVSPAPASAAPTQLRSQSASDIWAAASSAKAPAGLPVQRTQSAGTAAMTAARPAATQLLRTSASVPAAAKPAAMPAQSSSAAWAAVTPAAPAKQQLQQRLSAAGKATAPATPAAAKKVGLSGQSHQPASTVVGADFLDDWQQTKGKGKSKTAVPLGHNTKLARAQVAQPAAATQPTGVVMVQPRKTAQAGGKTQQAVPYTYEAAEKTVSEILTQGTHMETPEGAHKGVGLMNCGNTCFLNSTLQAVSALTPVQQLVSKFSVPACQTGSKDKKNKAGNLANFIYEANCMRTMTTGVHRPSLHVDSLTPVTGLEPGEQHDVYNYFLGLKESFGYGERLFEGKLESRIKYTMPGGMKSISDPTINGFQELALAFPESNTPPPSYTLNELMGHFTEGDAFTGYRVNGVTEAASANQSIRISEPPLVLSIILKRADAWDANAQKISTPVEYGADIDIYKYMTAQAREQDLCGEYELQSVVNHTGSSVRSGHYFTIAKGPDGQWYKYDDRNVTLSSLNEALRPGTYRGYGPSTPYMLLYVRKRTPQAAAVLPTQPTQAMAAQQLGKAVAAARVPQGMGVTAVRSPRGCFNSPPPPCAPVVGGVQCAR